MNSTGFGTPAITYATPKSTDAFLWLDASLTAGKKQPMLFTESQPTFARSAKKSFTSGASQRASRRRSRSR